MCGRRAGSGSRVPLRTCLLLRLAALPAVPVAAAAAAHEPTVDSLASGLAFSARKAPAYHVEVAVGVYLKHLFYFDDKEHQFSAEVYLTKRWHDSRNYSRFFEAPGIAKAGACSSTSGAPLRYVDVGEEASLFWDPDITIRNADSADVRYESTTLYEDGHFEHVSMMKVAVTLERHDFHEYPFDTQHLYMSIGPARSSSLRFSLRVDESVSGLDAQDALDNWPTWEYVSHEVYGEDYSPSSHASTRCDMPRANQVVMHIEVSRLQTPGVRIFAQSYLLVAASWGPFWVDPRKLMPRVSMAFLGLLTGVSWLQSVSRMKPETPYLTLFDVFETSILTMIACSLFCVVLAEYLYQTMSSAATLQLDAFARVFLPCNFLMLQLVLYLLSIGVSDLHTALTVMKYFVFANVFTIVGSCCVYFSVTHRRLWKQILRDPFHIHRKAHVLDANELSLIYKHLDKDGAGLVATLELRQWLTSTFRAHDSAGGRDTLESSEVEVLDGSLARKFPEFLNESEFRKHYHAIICDVEKCLFRKRDTSNADIGIGNEQV